MLYTRHETQALITRAKHVRRSRQAWDNEGIVGSALDVLAKDIDRDVGRLTAASAKYTSVDHPEAPALVAELAELVDVRQILFVPPAP